MAFEARPLGGLTYPLPGAWKGTRVGVFDMSADVDRKIGEYERNYPTMFHTFFPFRKDGKSLALYSPHYTATRIMELPSCRDLGGEEPSGGGFCPVDFYVPTDSDVTVIGDAAFVAGCVWGDDSSWKIEFLDLRRAADGEVQRDDRLGYIELPDGLRLADAIVVHRHDDPDREGFWAEVKTTLRRDLRTGEPLASYDV